MGTAAPEQEQRPAVEPKLQASIDAAIAQLQEWARASGQRWETLTDPDALLWSLLLISSRSDLKRGAAPSYPRSHFDRLSEERLTGRRWSKFQRWFSREIQPPLAKLCEERGLPLLYPGRSSLRSGGHPRQAQAIYFLSFDKPISSARGVSLPQPVPTTDGKRPTEVRQTGPLNVVGTDRSATSKIPLRLTLAMVTGQQDGPGAGSFVALFLVAVFLFAEAPVQASIANELLELIAAVREVLTGGVVIR